MPSFVPDLPGTYVAQLIVNDGTLDSDADTVTITTAVPPNRAPLADAGPDADGAAGRGRSAGWQRLERSGWRCALVSLVARHPARWQHGGAHRGRHRGPDLRGRSRRHLRCPTNCARRAGGQRTRHRDVLHRELDAGGRRRGDRTVARQTTVQLDGSGSSDADGGALLYSWSLLSQPVGSTATLSNTAIVNPTFVADADGVYVAQLIVSDGSLVSAPDTVAITAAPGADLAVALLSAPTTQPPGTALNWVVGPPASGRPRRRTSRCTRRCRRATPCWASIHPGTASTPRRPASGRSRPCLPARLMRLVIRRDHQPHRAIRPDRAVTNSSAPDPVTGNNTASAIVTPNRNADLRRFLHQFRSRDQESG